MLLGAHYLVLSCYIYVLLCLFCTLTCLFCTMLDYFSNDKNHKKYDRLLLLILLLPTKQTIPTFTEPITLFLIHTLYLSIPSLSSVSPFLLSNNSTHWIL